MDKSLYMVFQRAVKKDERAKNIRPDKGRSIINRAVNMALCCKMDNCINLLHDLIHNSIIADISANKRIVAVLFNIFQVIGISRIGQFIKIDDTVILIFIKHMPDKIAAYESAAACYKDPQSAPQPCFRPGARPQS